MKNMFKVLSLCVLGVLVFAQVPDAQQSDWRNQSALIISDVLLLDDEKTEKLVETYSDVRQRIFEDLQSSGTDWRNMSDEERTASFNKMQEDTIKGLKKELADDLTEQELDVVDVIVAKRVSTPVAELRALRLIALKDDQHEKIQPMSIELGKKMVPGGFRFFGQGVDETEREKAEKEFEEAKLAFVSNVKETLSEEQNKAWEDQIKESQKEIDELIRQRENFRRQQ